MGQQARNAIGSTLRRLRIAKQHSQQRLSVACARIGYELPRGTLAKIESGIRAVSDVELFVLAQALDVPVSDLFPNGLLRRIRDGTIAPFHVRGSEKPET